MSSVTLAFLPEETAGEISPNAHPTNGVPRRRGPAGLPGAPKALGRPGHVAGACPAAGVPRKRRISGLPPARPEGPERVLGR